ncbi:MAG: nucleoside monophosphate kinase [Candidatus Nomurabacteria bacterium]|jgi:adenylate kinase|nr:nucleoside monophosphate kinase [Candidatus Nomurabacteria bacterium]
MNKEAKIAGAKEWLGTGSINIFGLAFSGKDTVGKQLAELLGAEFLSSGDVVRAARENTSDSEIRLAALTSDSGVWTPTEEFKQLIVPYLYDEKLDGRALILSMVGRWIGEEEPVMAALEKGGHSTKAVVLLNVSEDEIWRRWELARDPDARNDGRADDSDEEKLRGRLDEYHDKTLPVIEIYRSLGLLVEIDGEQSRDAVMAEVIDKLYEFAGTNPA